MIRGAIVLCGGRSSRMGRDKATLPFGDETLLARVVRVLGDVVPAERIVCVAAAAQVLPPLGERVRVVRDRYPAAGPLGGLATGLAALEADVAFVVGCDTPLLVPAWIEQMFAELGERQIAAVQEGTRWQPLAAVYRATVRPIAEELLAAGERRLGALVERCDTALVNVERLRGVDPELRSLAHCNTETEYQRLLALAQLR